MDEFNIEELIESLGLNYENRLQPYDYERYRLFNPKLSENMYRFLRDNNCEWKILCGLRVTMDWSNDVLEPIAHLKSDIVSYTEYFEYKNRFSPENYLSQDYW
jgi:hypothetical protein